MTSAEGAGADSRADGARGEAARAPTGAILRQLLAREQDGLFSDAIVARTGGMMASLARQVLGACADLCEDDQAASLLQEEDRLAGLLAQNPDLLAHCHALAVEFAFSEGLQERAAIDPVTPPLITSLLASGESDLAGTAMHVLAAQARFLHAARRMELPLGELPAELFHAVISQVRGDSKTGDIVGADIAEMAVTKLSTGYDEADRRLSHIARLLLILEEHEGDVGALEQAGPSLFASSLSAVLEQDRDDIVLSMGERDPSRLMTFLKAADTVNPSATLAVTHPHCAVEA